MFPPQTGFDPDTGFRSSELVFKALQSLAGLLECYSSAAENEAEEKFTDSDKAQRKGQLSASECAQPLYVHLSAALRTLYEHPETRIRAEAILQRVV